MEPQAVRDAQIAGWDAATSRALQKNAGGSEADDETPVRVQVTPPSSAAGYAKAVRPRSAPCRSLEMVTCTRGRLPSTTTLTAAFPYPALHPGRASLRPGGPASPRWRTGRRRSAPSGRTVSAPKNGTMCCVSRPAESLMSPAVPRGALRFLRPPARTNEPNTRVLELRPASSEAARTSGTRVEAASESAPASCGNPRLGGSRLLW